MGRGPTGNDQETRTPIIILLFHIISVRKQELTSSSVPPVRCLFFLCGEYVFNRFHTITHTAHIHKHTHAHSLSRKKHTHTIYEEEVEKKTYNAYYINIRKNKKTRNQCVAIKPGKKERRRFPWKAKPCIAESFLSHNNARRNMYVRKRMNMMFLYSIIISIVLPRAEETKKNSKILSPAAALFVCMLIPAAESSFPLFLRFTPQSFFLIKTKIL